MVYEQINGLFMAPNRWAQRIIAAAFPPTCVLCKGDGCEGMDLCSGCLEDLPKIGIACMTCGLPLPGATAFSVPCGACLKKPKHFDLTLCPYRFAEPVDWLVRQLKFRARLPHIRVLGALLKQHLIDTNAETPQLIIPVPLHHTRQRERGFNQALEIARPLAKHFNVPVASALCERHQNTPSQSELPAKKRAANIRNAFRLRKPCEVKHVAIVDDVMTTGATVNELAKLLKRNGVEKVQVWVVARAIQQ